ncbi:MAG TPA: DinB family protein [Candidatus Dormibacteraeota bacterium]|nr:DinB family protein [Candidatus Dormibacteraeota bacterium]
MADEVDEERMALLYFLEYQRASVLSIVEGLEQPAWYTPAVPSGWTVAGLIEHLGDAERHWFQGVGAGSVVDLPWDDGRPPYDPQAAFVCDRPVADVRAYHREQCRRSDEALSSLSLGAAPQGRHGKADRDEPPTVRWIALHMIEETACRSGHLEIARELLDGRTRLGLR